MVHISAVGLAIDSPKAEETRGNYFCYALNDESDELTTPRIKIESHIFYLDAPHSFAVG